MVPLFFFAMSQIWSPTLFNPYEVVFREHRFLFTALIKLWMMNMGLEFLNELSHCVEKSFLDWENVCCAWVWWKFETRLCLVGYRPELYRTKQGGLQSSLGRLPASLQSGTSNRLTSFETLSCHWLRSLPQISVFYLDNPARLAHGWTGKVSWSGWSGLVKSH